MKNLKKQAVNGLLQNKYFKNYGFFRCFEYKNGEKLRLIYDIIQNTAILNIYAKNS